MNEASFSLLDILNFDLSSNILEIFVVLLLKLLLVNGEWELSNNGEFLANGEFLIELKGELQSFSGVFCDVFFSRSIEGCKYSGDTFCISPRILRLDGVAIGDGVLLKLSECGFIFSL